MKFLVIVESVLTGSLVFGVLRAYCLGQWAAPGRAFPTTDDSVEAAGGEGLPEGLPARSLDSALRACVQSCR